MAEEKVDTSPKDFKHESIIFFWFVVLKKMCQLRMNTLTGKFIEGFGTYRYKKT